MKQNSIPPRISVILTVIFSVSQNHGFKNDYLHAPNVPVEIALQLIVK